MYIETKDSKQENEVKLCIEKNRNKYTKTRNTEYTVENLNALFIKLQNEENPYDNETLQEIKDFAKHHILISPDNFEYLVMLASSVKKYDLVKEIIEIIVIYSEIENNKWFCSVVPPNLLERISMFLPHSAIFTIFDYYFIRKPVEASELLIQMNIIDKILENLHKFEAIVLYSDMLQNEITKEICEQHYACVVTEVIQNFIDTKDSDIIHALCRLVINEECVQCIMQASNFFTIFEHKYNHYTLIELMDFIDFLCQPDKSVALMIAKSPIWEFINNALEKNEKIKKSPKRKLDFDKKFLRFLYYISGTREGIIFLYENNVHSTLFEKIKNTEFQNFDSSIKIICQMGTINDINIVTDIVDRGLIDILSQSITCLCKNAKRAAIDCISNIQAIGEINENLDLQSFIFDNEDLMEAVNQMIYSKDQFISDLSRALCMRFKGWGIDDNL